MKKIIFLILTLFAISLMYSQKISTKLKGINTTVSISAKDVVKVFNLDIKVPKTETEQIGTAVKTDSTAIYKTTTYPVYKTEKGKLFIVYKNKNSGYSKKYIKSDITTDTDIKNLAQNP